MKVLHLVHVNHMGNGITAVVSELAKAQKQFNNDVKVINLRVNSIEIENFIICKNLGEYISILDSFKPDIVIIHGIFYKEVPSYTRVLYKKRIPYVLEPHGAYSYENYRKNTLKKWLFKKIYLENVIKHSSGWIFLNNAEKNNFSININNKSSFIIPNGCGSHQQLQTEHNPEKKIRFLYLSRIAIYHKGLDLLIDAIKTLDKKIYKNIVFEFYGPGSLSDLEKFKKMSEPLSHLINYYGPVYGNEKDKILMNSDIFILSSRFEGFPMSILEALSYGTPCIVSKGTNVSDIIKENNCGWIVPQLTVQDIACTIKQSIEEYTSNYAEFRENALIASNEYQWDKIAHTSIQIYKKVIDKSQEKFL